MKFALKAPVKASCIILFIIVFSFSVICGAGIICIEALGAYDNSSKKYSENIIYTQISDQLHDIAINYHYSTIYPDTDTGNLGIVILDENGSTVFSNAKEDRSVFYSASLDLVKSSYGDADFSVDFFIHGENELSPGYTEPQALLCKVKGYVYDSSEIKDKYYYLIGFSRYSYENRYNILLWFSVMLLLSVILFVYLMYASGITPNGHKRLRAIDKIPIDLFFIIILTIEIFIICLLAGCIENYRLSALCLFASALTVILFTAFLLMFFMSVSARIKNGSMLKNSVIYKFFAFIASVFRKIPAVWQIALISGALIVFNLFLMLIAVSSRNAFPVFIYFVFMGVIFAVIIKASYDYRKINEAAEKISSGFLHYKADTKNMYGDLKKHAETINSIGNGIEAAVNEQMKSERLKTELITNVSHDIKTPLTSIINYVDLLKKAPSKEESEKYIAVLDRQSHRLKKLTEDLVEASKAATGNISTQLTSLDICQLIKQAVGEYSDKLENAKLEPVVTFSSSEMFVTADGKLMWRIIDNLLSNACKYSQSETRLYIDVFEKKDTFIVFKNISKERLNIPADELLERFVRADSSRSSEGSGLGLNIAKSLAEIQNGTLLLEIDGDLFRVTLTLPTAEKITADLQEESKLANA